MKFAIAVPIILCCAGFLTTPHSACAAEKFGAVNAAGVSIKGLTSEQATRRLRRELGKKMNAKIRLTDGKRAASVRRKDLGLSPDVGYILARAKQGDKYIPLRLNVNRTAVQSTLRRLSPRFSTAARDAAPIRYRGRVVIRKEQNRRTLNLGGAVIRVTQTLEKNGAATRIALPVRETPPTITQQRLKGINAVLATFTTRFNPDRAKRTNNMKIAIRSIHGTLLSPNEVFSLNQTVGERTQARGYRATIVLQNGYEAPGIGGGVSQVTGTLFNAALLAGLPIVTYRTHSRPVAYLPLGRDATVAWGSFDMKFRNGTRAPIFIDYRLSGDHATATLFGTRKRDQVRLSVVRHQIGPRHIKAKLYRSFRRGNKLVKKELVGNSEYKWNVGAWED